MNVTLKKPRNAWWSYGRGCARARLPWQSSLRCSSTFIRFVIILQLQAVMVWQGLRQRHCFARIQRKLHLGGLCFLQLLPLRYSLDICAFHFPCHNKTELRPDESQHERCRRLRMCIEMLRCGSRRIVEIETPQFMKAVLTHRRYAAMRSPVEIPSTLYLSIAMCFEDVLVHAIYDTRQRH